MGFSRSFGPFAVVAVSICLPLSSSFAAVPTKATRDLLADKTGLMGMVSGTRLSALYGAALATSADYPGAPDFVAAFLADLDHGQDAFGVDNCDLVLKDQIVISGGEMTVHTYDQQIEGLRVFGRAVKLLVVHGVPDTLTYASIKLAPHPASPLPADVWTAANAIAVVQASYPHLTTFDEPDDAELLIFEDDTQTIHRAWKFVGEDDDERYSFFVDTNSATILDAISLVWNATVRARDEITVSSHLFCLGRMV